MADYTYDPVRRRYLAPNGKVVSLEVVRALRDRWADIQADVIRGFAANVETGVWSLAEFEVATRAWLGETIGAGYQLGRGGSGMMSVDDAFELARLISNQTRYMERLIADKQGNLISDAQFGVRAEMYAGAAIEAFEVGQARSSGGLDLPCYPADGDTSCMMSCRCYWEIEDVGDAWEAYWVTVGDERVCPECEERGQMYNPFVQVKG